MNQRRIEIQRAATVPSLVLGLSLLAPPVRAQQGGVNCSGCDAQDGSDVEWASGGHCDGVTLSLLVDIGDGECLRRNPMKCDMEDCSYNYQVEWAGAGPGWNVFMENSWEPGVVEVVEVDDDGHGFYEPDWTPSMLCFEYVDVEVTLKCEGEPLPWDLIELSATGHCTPCPAEDVSSVAPPPLFDAGVSVAGAAWLEIEDEVFDRLVRTPEQHERFKRLHTEWLEIPDARWVANRSDRRHVLSVHPRWIVCAALPSGTRR